jgi:apolipoprotein N-acyltransferase
MAQIVAIGSLLGLIPYLADRLTRTRLRGLIQTLVFPCTFVAVEFLGAFRSGTTWGNIAYTQSGNLPVLQLASVTGIWGISFLIAWLAPVINNLWEEDFSFRQAAKGVWVFTSVFGLIFILGGLRLLLFPPSSQSLTVATVTPPELLDVATPDDLQAFQRMMMKQEVTASEAEAARQTFASTYDRLFSDTRSEARAGASVVAWPEGSLVSFDEKHDRALIERGQRLASEEGIYLFMTIALVPLDRERLNENRVILIGPDGEILQTYLKTYTVPVVEEPFAVPGSGRVALQDTPYGRLAAVICYDMDSPRFLRGAGELEADILFAPSGDWPAIKELHPRMAVLRGVEQGFSLVRPANHGLNLSSDYQGRILAQLDHFTTSDRRMVVKVPIRGVRTIYSIVGDAFAWLCVTGSILLLLVALRPPLSQSLTPLPAGDLAATVVKEVGL